MKRKVIILDIYVGPKKIKCNKEITEIEIKNLNKYDTLEDFVSYYVIEDLIFISLTKR